MVEQVDNSQIRSPRYIQVYTAVRNWIYRGRYAPGVRLPTENDLCTMFGVSKITVRRAMEMLVDEEMVVRRRGRGTFVVEDLAEPPMTGDMEQLLLKVDRLAQSTTVSSSEIVTITADRETRLDLELPDGARVHRASHVRMLDGEPIGYNVTYIPADLSIGFDLSELNEQPMLALLERAGVSVASADQVFGACLADARLASLLHIAVGAPLMDLRLVVFDEQRRPVERLVAYYRADIYRHHVHLTRKSR